MKKKQTSCNNHRGSSRSNGSFGAVEKYPCRLLLGHRHDEKSGKVHLRRNGGDLV